MTAIREVIDIEELRTKLLAEGRIGYIWFAAFSNDSTPQVEKALHQLLEVDKVEGLILDIRGNRGGDLRTAVAILSQFLHEGKTAWVLATPGPFACPDCPTTTHAEGIALEIPLVVLIDEGTGSAAELFVAAIKDHKRATLIGTTTYGKGVGGLPFPLSNGGRVFISTFEFRSPGAEINKTLCFIKSAAKARWIASSRSSRNPLNSPAILRNW
jgi:carboxyl-terminal processing protease